MQQTHFLFHLPPAQSPTYYNLHQRLLQKDWWYSHDARATDFNTHHFSFDERVAETLEYKHLLAKLINQHCPEVAPFTCPINDSNWHSVIAHIRHNPKLLACPWILKPALLNNGQNIQIFTRLSDIEDHYSHTNRLGGEHVLQQYLAHPHLLAGYKYSIRMFVIVTNYNGVYIYPEGYLNVAKHRYVANQFHDLRPHLTNEHLLDTETNVVQVPTKPIAGFARIYQQIKTIVSKIMAGLKISYPSAEVSTPERTLGIFGFDFMVDEQLQVWLLEVNHGPCFPCDDAHPLQKPLYEGFWQAIIVDFVLPIARRMAISEMTYQWFECI